MNRLAKGEIYFNKYFSIDELISNINKVACDDVFSLSKEIFNKKMQHLVILGNLEEDVYSFWNELIS